MEITYRKNQAWDAISFIATPLDDIKKEVEKEIKKKLGKNKNMTIDIIDISTTSISQYQILITAYFAIL